MIERRLYDARIPNRPWFWMFDNGRSTSGPPLPENTAISIKNLKKVYNSPWFSRKQNVTAIDDLSLDIPKTGIFVLLGSNGCVIVLELVSVKHFDELAQCWKIDASFCCCRYLRSHLWQCDFLRRYASTSAGYPRDCTTEKCVVP